MEESICRSFAALLNEAIEAFPKLPGGASATRSEDRVIAGGRIEWGSFRRVDTGTRDARQVI